MSFNSMCEVLNGWCFNTILECKHSSGMMGSLDGEFVPTESNRARCCNRWIIM